MNAVTNRLWSIDSSRGLSVIMMICLHLGLIVGLSGSVVYAIGLFQPEPFFILVAGLSAPILLSKKYIAQDRRILLIRGLLLIIIDLAMIFTASLVWPSVYVFRLYWGVFQIIGVSYFLLFFINMNLKRALVMFASLVVASPIMSYFNIDLFGNMFFNLSYFFAGICIYYFIYQQKIGIIWFLVATIAVYLTCFILDLNPLTWSYQAFQMAPVMAVLVISTNIALVVKILSLFDQTKKVSSGFSWLASLGRVSFSIFVLHIVIIYAMMRAILLLFPMTTIPIQNNLLYIILSFITVGLLIIIERVWRIFDYKFGLEWVFRQGVGQILRITDKIIHRN